MRFKSVSIREDNLKEIDTLSKSLLPKVHLSKAQTIAKVLDIAKDSLGKSKINQEKYGKREDTNPR
tara:strand:+ start:275 stop:472 length:198 start_codon:yes stop_codon:yes gene_type:complete